jgi:hypothetical protein
MRRAYLRQHGKSSIELIEEAFYLLRAAAPATLAAYFLGSVPFVAALLFFCTDMSRSPFAAQHLPEASLTLALFFFWMKFFQARFARLLRAQVSGDPSGAGGPKSSVRSLAVQTILQSSALFVLPVAAFIVLPFAWVYAFYQNVTALDDGERNPTSVFRLACQEAAQWPRQNHAMLLMLSALGFSVFLNWVSFSLFAPQLLKMLFGIESVFSQSPLSMLNTTFFATMFGLTYLCLDPLIKACYVLRCFYGTSLRSGEDLKAELRRIASVTRTVLICLALCLGAESVPARELSPPSERAPQADVRTSVSPPELDRAIGEVIRQTKYTWRMPREKEVEKIEDGVIARFLTQIHDMIKSALRAVLDAIQSLINWLFPDRRPRSETGAKEGWMALQQGLLVVALAVTACTLAIFILRFLRARRRSQASIGSMAIPSTPNLEDENIGADQLPEEGWTRLGREFQERGELRLALRAFYLASLSHLAARGLVTIARFKSNRDYERELRRRGHAFPDLLPLFGENVGVFDRIWYGLHKVSIEVVERFVTNVERIKAAT